MWCGFKFGVHVKRKLMCLKFRNLDSTFKYSGENGLNKIYRKCHKSYSIYEFGDIYGN